METMPCTAIIEAQEINEAIQAIAQEIASRHQFTEGLVIAGIANGGIPFAQLLGEQLTHLMKRFIPIGCVNSAFHRNDIGRNPMSKVYLPTSTPWDAHNATVLLVDDILCSGRTIRAALAEVFNQGRPAAVELVILMDRGHYCLPIRPDYVGFTKKTNPTDVVKARLSSEKPSSNIIEIYSS